jgi:hypothetical protein
LRQVQHRSLGLGLVLVLQVLLELVLVRQVQVLLELVRLLELLRQAVLPPVRWLQARR